MGVKGKYFLIVSETTGLVLDVKNASDSPGTEVVMWEKSGNNNQVWYEHPVTGTVRSKSNDLCLDVNGSNRLVVDNYKKGEENQLWRYNKQRRTVESYSNSDKVFDVVEESTDSGAEICIWDYHGKDNQKWRIEPIYFFIKSAMNGKVLDIKDSSTDSGAKVIMYEQKDADDAGNQLWFEDRYGNIRPKINPSLVLDTTDDCLRTGEFEFGDRKKFWCVFGNRVVNRYDVDEVLDIKGEDSDDGAEVCGYRYKGSDNQHWHFEFVTA